jgi:IS5 family transposase
MKEYSQTKILKLASSLYTKAQRSCPMYSSKFSKKTYTQPQHVAMLGLKKKLKEDYRDIVELIAEMPRIQEALELTQIPEHTTLCKAFTRLSKIVFMVLLELTVPDGTSGTYGIDSTGLSRLHSSKHYAKRCKIRIRSMKSTFLVNSEKQLVVALHTTTTKKHDTRIILPVIAGCNNRIDALVADKGYDDNRIREALRSVGINPVIPYREQTALDKLANSKLDKKTYHKRSLNETVNSVIKRKYGEELVSRKWRNQQKEVYMLCILHNIERQLMVIWVGFQQSHKQSSVEILRNKNK